MNAARLTESRHATTWAELRCKLNAVVSEKTVDPPAVPDAPARAAGNGKRRKARRHVYARLCTDTCLMRMSRRRGARRRSSAAGTRLWTRRYMVTRPLATTTTTRTSRTSLCASVAGNIEENPEESMKSRKRRMHPGAAAARRRRRQQQHAPLCPGTLVTWRRCHPSVWHKSP